MQVWEAPLVICLSTFVPVLRLGFCDSNYFISICAIISLLINREKLAGQVSVAASLGVLRDFSMVGVEIVQHLYSTSHQEVRGHVKEINVLGDQSQNFTKACRQLRVTSPCT
jgi:hypothetical protein